MLSRCGNHNFTLIEPLLAEHALSEHPFLHDEPFGSQAERTSLRQSADHCYSMMIRDGLIVEPARSSRADMRRLARSLFDLGRSLRDDRDHSFARSRAR
jgi:hypothetical protein